MSVQTVHARVDEISPLTDSIVRLVLAPETFIDYQAGQYLQILLGDEAFSYSIANAPLGSHKYELHIRHSADNPTHQALFAHIRTQGTITLRLPYGECCIDHLDLAKPILFIAGGTGFAPVKAMIEQLLAIGWAKPFELFWGARSQSDLYMDEQVNNWAHHCAHFNYYSLIGHESKHALCATVQKKHLKDLKDWQIVISGPFDMVYRMRDDLVREGISETALFSDAFSFEQK